MKTIVLATAIRILIPLFIIFSVYTLFRGHNHPGGGFIGGLIGSIAFVFHTMTHGPQHTVDTFLKLNLYGYPRQPNQSRSLYLMRMMRVNVWRRRKMARHPDMKHHMVRIESVYIIATGLFLAVTSGVLGLLSGQPFMHAYWTDFYIPVLGKPGTPILFDLGVYLLVIGVVLKITFVMSEE
ncbi:MnhB domain-containing protein [Pontibacter amylolyticus]|uniref:Na(+)/H(+) antiporter subunit B n=1 Tax=Pontibacter amylolyticus TaxID=1424080 RepID=A0ABQ1VV34_9BACT|nr:MnhB domain-containing protein [Pontibacter amylolyticus]GGF99831.1 Na(+)/H(+) antiporter subunit B [Pontibacter amylolyticus]